ncbi:hypothetical protein [Brevibacillus daliensis]|uniref:hypothetical protein n=1 Tax=Brevibacillus daliensis TaxID=2892995 RepID=UPI001E5E5929|nr:hypothetical protein [Brevibacillus daliensis]
MFGKILGIPKKIILFLLAAVMIIEIAIIVFFAMQLAKTNEQLYYSDTVVVKYNDGTVVKVNGEPKSDNSIVVQQKGSFNPNFVTIFSASFGFIGLAISMGVFLKDLLSYKKKGTE